MRELENSLPALEALDLEIAIVGGGIAGLYCLYRLLKSGQYDARKIKLYESCDHLGGRIETWSMQRVRDDYNSLGFVEGWDPRHELADKNSGTGDTSYGDPERVEYFRAEFGPMRIEPKDQPFLKKLLDELGIEEPKPGARKSWDDLIPFFSYSSEDPQSPKFTLKGEEGEQKTPIDLLLLGIRRILELIDEPKQFNDGWKKDDAKNAWQNFHGAKSFYRQYWKAELLEWINHLEDSVPDDELSDYQTIRTCFTIKGYSLWDLGFWNVLNDVLSHYAVVKIRDWGTYYHLLHQNLNAAEWIIFWLKAIKGTHSLRGIRGGMTWLIHKLIQRIAEHGNENGQTLKGKLNGLIEIGHELCQLSLDDKGIRLHFTEKKATGDETIEVNNNKSKTAKHVILALPKRPLEKLNFPKLFGEKGMIHDKGKIEKALASVKGLRLLKCFFILENPWWEDDRPLNRHASDFPTRELSYYKSIDKTKGMLMIYTDHPSITFWSDYLREFRSPNQPTQENYTVWWRVNEPEPNCPLWDPSTHKWISELPENVKNKLDEQIGRDTGEWTPTVRNKIIDLSEDLLNSIDNESLRSSFNQWVNKTKNLQQQKRLWIRFVQFMRDYEHHDFSPDRLLACGIHDWGKEPFGAAAHGWLPGEKSWEHIKYLAAFPTGTDDTINAKWREKIHICGEAYSDYQGFIEGSLRSAWKTIEKLL